MAEPKDMIVPMLREMRQQMTDMQAQNTAEFHEI